VKAVRSVGRERRCTHVETANLPGIDRSYLLEIETGKKDPSSRVLETIADEFKLSLSQLLRGF